MSVHSCYSADDWAKMTDCKVRVDGAWKQCKSIHANVDGEWKKVWPAVTVTVSSDPLVRVYESPSYLVDIHANTDAPYDYYYPSTLTLTVSGDDSASYTLPTGNEIVISAVITQDDGSTKLRYPCSYTYSADTKTWVRGDGIYEAIDSEAFTAGTYEFAVVTSETDDFAADIVSNLGTLTVFNLSCTITTSTLELENVTTVSDLTSALQTAGFVATASNFHDGWVVPSSSVTDPSYSLVVLALLNPDGSYVVDSTGQKVCFRMVRGQYSGTTYGSDTSWGLVSLLSGSGNTSLSAGVYSFKLYSYDGIGLDTDYSTITFHSGTITIKEATKFVDPFYPYFSSTGNQHTTGIGLNQYNIISDLVIRKYTSSSSAGELFPEGTKFRIDQKGQGSGYTIFDLDAEGNLRNIYNNSGWTIKITGNTYMTDSAVLTAVDGGAYWWDGTKAVSSVTLTIN